jgi:hypothetical protein
MIPQIVTVGPLAAASANNIALSQTPAGAQALTLNGSTVTAGVAILDVARRVLFTFAADESAKTFRVTGTNSTGNAIQETVQGTAATASTTISFKTVTEIFASAATTGALTVGTSGLASSPWQAITYQFGPVQVSWGCVVSGTVNYSVQFTYDPINSNQNTLGGALGNYPIPPLAWPVAGLTAMAVTADAALDNPFVAWRVVINSGTGSVTVTGIQAGIINSK